MATPEIEEQPETVNQYVEIALEKQVGGAGRFQKTNLVLLNLPWTYSAMMAYAGVFAGAEPENLELLNCTLPRQDLGHDHFSYVADFQLVCGRHELVPLLSTLYFLGFLFGVPTFGASSDWFGRRRACVASLVVVQLGCALGFTAPNYWVYAASKVVTGFGIAGFGLVSYVWNVEALGSEIRPVMAAVPNVFWSMGQLFLSPLSYFVRQWRHLLLTLFVLGSSFFVYIPRLLESPKWLAAKGRADEAYAVLCGVASQNDRSAPPKPAAGLAHPTESRTANVLQLLDRRLLPRFLIMCLNWFSTSYVYFGLSLGADSLPLNLYWANAVAAVSVLPACLLALLMVESERFGRRGTATFGFLLTGSCLILCSFAKSTLRVVLYSVATSGASLCFADLYIFASELFPTDIRGASMGLQSLCARVGAMLAPFVADLSSSNKTMELWFFATPCIAAGLLTLCLPETRGRALPSSLSNGDSSGEDTSGAEESSNSSEWKCTESE